MDQNQNPNNPKQQIVETLKGATNVLVTVSQNPTVDQLAACIGLTLLLNKLDKHATAVFSGAIPSTIEFLQPEKTIESNTDSLRDFIISLDRAKADKLRYKVEDSVVKIFITPYRTSLSEADLQYSQGDFNVDVVVALGVDQRDHLDEAIAAHGRILHDASVVGLSCGNAPTDIGAVNWHEPAASSLSEMLVSISESFQSGLLDGQMATAFLTGIVAETDRFRNEKTTPKVMTMSAQLMAAGANQQLIAEQLETKAPEPEPEAPLAETMPHHDEQAAEQQEEKTEFEIPKEGEEGPDTSSLISLQEEIAAVAPEMSGDGENAPEQPKLDAPAPPVLPEPEADLADVSKIHIDENGQLHDSGRPDESNPPLPTPEPEAVAPPAPESASEEPGALVEPSVAAVEPDRAEDETPVPNEPESSGILPSHKVIQPLNHDNDPPKTDLRSYIFEPPSQGGTFTGSTLEAQGGDDVPAVSPPSQDMPMLSHDHRDPAPADQAAPSELPAPGEVPAIPAPEPPMMPEQPAETPLAAPFESSIPQVPPAPEVPAPSVDQPPAPAADADAARAAILNAIAMSDPAHPSPIEALNAQPLALDAPLDQPNDPSAPSAPPVPPPLPFNGMPGVSPSDTSLPAPDQPAASNNPFNLPPIR